MCPRSQRSSVASYRALFDAKAEAEPVKASASVRLQNELPGALLGGSFIVSRMATGQQISPEQKARLLAERHRAVAYPGSTTIPRQRFLRRGFKKIGKIVKVVKRFAPLAKMACKKCAAAGKMKAKAGKAKKMLQKAKAAKVR